MSTLRQVIERERDLRKLQKPNRILVSDGLNFKERATGDKVLYCPSCYAPLVDSPRARANHAQRKPKCAEALGVK
jgi:hypothetical protein